MRGEKGYGRAFWWLMAAGILLLVFLDQWLKVWVKTHMYLGEEFMLCGDWARIHFLENEGIAFGMSLGSAWGKVLISVLRIVTAAAMCVLLARAARSRSLPRGMLVGTGLLLAGALGNILDGTFYGMLFSSSEGFSIQNGELLPIVAEWLPEGGGYAGIFRGKVVDMLYFPLIRGSWPDWVPGWGGESFEFFRPVFNLADAQITVGVLYLLLFHGRALLLGGSKRAE